MYNVKIERMRKYKFLIPLFLFCIPYYFLQIYFMKINENCRIGYWIN